MYLVPSGSVEKEFIVKKSRFIASAGRVSDKSEAKVFLNQIRLAFPDAGHHCWAYLTGNPSNAMTAAMSDDGEPSGTAGKPILNVLQHKMVGDVMIVVTRYFGGIKLGAGGLVRAYSNAAQLAMDSLQTEEHRLLMTLHVSVAFSDEAQIRHWLNSVSGVFVGAEYAQNVKCEVAITQDHLPALVEICAAYRWQIDDGSDR